MHSVSEPIVVEFRGFCSKKNRKAPRPGGHGLFLEPKARNIIQRMELQVPAEARDLMLESPEVEWFVTYTNGHIDMDGIMTTVLDILQKYRVIVNDNLVHFGGKQTIWEPIRGEYDSVKIVLIPKVGEPSPTSPRYIDPRRRRMAERTRISTAPAVAEPTVACSSPDCRSGLDELEDIPESEEPWDDTP